MAITWVVIASAAAVAAEAERPNVVLIMCDDLGWGDVGFNGGKTIRTPHLDKMAAAGMRFERFYAAAPVCSPTRGSCLTGRHPYRYGIRFANVGHMQPAELTLAELLARQGYATGHFGKWHLGTLTKTELDSNRGGPRGVADYSPPWDNGFETCFSTEAKVPTWDPLLRPAGNKSRAWWHPVTDDSQAELFGTAYWSNGKRVNEPLRGDDSKLIVDRAVPFIREAVADDRPFFAIVWFHAPHLPVVAGPRHAAMYAEHEPYHQHYYGCVTALDEQVGRLRGELRQLDVADDTLVFFCSDNGPEGNQKAPGTTGGLRGRKRSLWEGGIRVPGLVEWPARIPPASKTIVPACTSDYLPTILDILNVTRDDARPLDGVSLLPLLAGDQEQRGTAIGFESSGRAALVGDRYKIITRTDVKLKDSSVVKPSDVHLFDLVTGRSESTDLATEQPDRVRAMVAELQAWRESCREE